MEKKLSGHCLVCGTVLTGLLGKLFRLFGIRRSGRNPNICTRCDFHIAEGRVAELSVLFADLTGFTSLTNQLGADRTFEVVDSFLKMASRHLVSHDGFIDKYIGDAVMAFFNVPIAREDHAGQAVAAAEDILDELPSLGETVGCSLQARIGIATGYARVGRLGAGERSDYTVIGDVANLASRLEGHAQPGEILVSHEVFERISASYPDGRAESLVVKGFDKPVEVYRLRRSEHASGGSPVSDAANSPSHGSLRLSLGSVLFTILGMPCAVVTTVSPLASLLGASAAFGAAAPVFGFLDQAVVRVPLQCFAVLAAFANLYTLWFGRAQRASLPETKQERRKVAVVAGLSVVALAAVGWELYVHSFVLKMPYFSP